MIIIKIALIGVGGALLSMAAGQVKKEYSIFILLGVCLILSGYLLADFHGIIDFINDLTSRIEISETYIRILYKLLAISFVSQIASGICQDMGYKSISYQIELIGKISILVLSIPILQSLLDTIDTVV